MRTPADPSTPGAKFLPGTDGPSARADDIPAVEPPPVSAALRRLGPRTLGHETNLARAPLWDARARPVQLSLVAPTVLYGQQFRQVAGARLTVTDQRLFAELTTRFVRDDCPETRRVPFSLGEAARLLGHESLGGKQRQIVKQSLARMRSVTVESALRSPDGHETVIGWGLIDRYLTTTRGGGRGSAKLSEEVAALLRAGSVTYLHAPTWDAIAAADEIAGRLWAFLEAENLGSGWRYQLFAAAPDGIAEDRNMPAIAELLRLDWAQRKKVAWRVKQACAVICDIDPRYRLELIKSKAVGMWRLDAARQRREAAAGSRRRAARLPDIVLAAWRRRYRAHLPSRKQLDVLADVIARHDSDWVAATLSEAEDDAFSHLLACDRAVVGHRLREADERERRHAAEKRANAEEIASIRAMLAHLRDPAEATPPPAGE